MTTSAIPSRTGARTRVIDLALKVIAAERTEPHAHSDDDLWYSIEQLELACRDLTNAVYADPDDHPVGWHPRSAGPATDLTGTIRRKPGGTVLAVLWDAPLSRHRWLVTDCWGFVGYEADKTVAAWPVAGVMPFSPAAGFPLTPVPADRPAVPGADTVTVTSGAL